MNHLRNLLTFAGSLISMYQVQAQRVLLHVSALIRLLVLTTVLFANPKSTASSDLGLFANPPLEDFNEEPEKTLSLYRYFDNPDSLDELVALNNLINPNYSKGYTLFELLMRNDKGVPRYLVVDGFHDTDGNGIPDVMEDYFDLKTDRKDAVTDEVYRCTGYTVLEHYLAGQDLGDPEQPLLQWLSDGIPNVWKVRFGFSLDDPTIAVTDIDFDGLDNSFEYLLGTDPYKSDIKLDGSEKGSTSQAKEATGDQGEQKSLTSSSSAQLSDFSYYIRQRAKSFRSRPMSLRSISCTVCHGAEPVEEIECEIGFEPSSIDLLWEPSRTVSLAAYLDTSHPVNWSMSAGTGFMLSQSGVLTFPSEPPNAPVTVIVDVTHKNNHDHPGPCSASISVSISPVDIDAGKVAKNIPTDFTHPLDDAVEETEGAFVPLNIDDDDYSATTSSLGEDKDQTGAVTGENDLLPIYLHAISMPSAKFLLDIPSNIKVWKNQDRTDEVISTTEIDAAINSTLYVEGISKGDGVLKVGVKKGANHYPDRDRIKITTFEIKGPLNVPGYSKHLYSASGQLPSGAQWLTPESGSITSGSGTQQIEILWEEGPVLGKAIYELNANYSWELSVNVVQVKLMAGTSNSLTYHSALNQATSKVLIRSLSGSTPAMTANLTVEKVEGPLINGSTRGEKFLEMGFIQNLQVYHQHGNYFGLTPSRRRKSILEPAPSSEPAIRLDYYTDSGRSTSPWYDSNDKTVAGANGFHQVPHGGVTNLPFKVADSPQLTGTDTLDLVIGPNGDGVDEYVIVVEFKIYFCVRSVQAVNDTEKKYTQRGISNWTYDASGDISTPPLDFSWTWTQTGSGISGSHSFNEVQDGLTVPRFSGIPFNDRVADPSFTWSTDPP